MMRYFSLLVLTLPFAAQAEKIHCDAKFLDLTADAPVLGYIRTMVMNDKSITLITEDNKALVYQIDLQSSIPAQRSYSAKTGNLPINQTPMNQQIAVMLVKPEDANQKDFDGILTDSRLDNYVLLNCKSKP
jgi:hypothetical protein